MRFPRKPPLTFRSMARPPTGFAFRSLAAHSQAEAANDVRIVVAVDITLTASTAAYVEATRTLTITYSAASQAFTAVKTAVDAISGITSAYYGNAAGADIGSVMSGAFAGGRTNWCYVRVTVVTDLLIKMATSTPANADDDTARVAIEEQVWEGIIPPGERFYCKRRVRHGRHRLRRNVAHEPGRIPHVPWGLTELHRRISEYET